MCGILAHQGPFLAYEVYSRSHGCEAPPRSGCVCVCAVALDPDDLLSVCGATVAQRERPPAPPELARGPCFHWLVISVHLKKNSRPTCHNEQQQIQPSTASPRVALVAQRTAPPRMCVARRNPPTRPNGASVAAPSPPLTDTSPPLRPRPRRRPPQPPPPPPHPARSEAPPDSQNSRGNTPRLRLAP